MEEQEFLHRVVFWAGLATAATLVLLFAASGSFYLLLGAVGGILGAAAILTGLRLETKRESPVGRVLIGTALLAVGVWAILAIAVPVAAQVTAGLIVGLLAAGVVWGVWTRWPR